MSRATAVAACSISLATAAICVAAPNRWTEVTPPGGFVSEVHVAATTPRRIYAVVNGTLFWTTDDGDTWTPRNAGLPFTKTYSDLRVQNVLVDRTDPDVLNAIVADQLFRSVDAGATWTLKPNPASPTYPRIVQDSFLVNDPVTPGRCYLVFVRSLAPLIWVSTDRGDTWAPLGVPAVSGRGVSTFAVDPVTPTTYYAGTFNAFFVSLDQGGSWTQRGGGLPTLGASYFSLIAAPTMPTTLYLQVQVSGDPSEGLYRSTDGGTSWTLLVGGFFFPLALDPSDPLTLYAEGSAGDIHKTTTGGDSFTPIAKHAPGTDDRYTRALAIDPTDTARLWAATDGGVLLSVDGGSTWSITNAGQGAGGAMVPEVVLAPGSSSVIYAAGRREVWRSTDAGAHWSPHTPEPPRPVNTAETLSLATDPSAPLTQYLGSSVRGMFKTVDAGDTWTPADSGLSDQRVWAVAVDAGGTIYAATQGGLFASTDGASSWSLRNPSFFGDLTADPGVPGTLYVQRGARKSTDGGSTFATPGLVALLATPQPGEIAQGITAMAIAPAIPSTVYLGHVTAFQFGTASYTVYKSLDRLESGTLTASFNASLLAVDPSDSDTVYGATLTPESAFRVVRSRNGASTFASLSAGLPETPYTPSAFAIDATGTTVYYATDAGGLTGSGVFRMDLPSCAADTDCDDGQACTTDTCIGGRCEYAAMADGTACSGVEDDCGFSGTCYVGECTRAVGICNDGDSCTLDACAVGGACLHLGGCFPPTTTTSSITTTSVTTTSVTTTSTVTTTTMPRLLTGRTFKLVTNLADPSRKRVGMSSKDVAIDLGNGDGSADDPVLHGATVRIVSSSGGFDTTYPMTGNWRYAGQPGQNRGYRWTSAGGPITSLVVKPGKSIRLVGRGAGLGDDLNDDPNPVSVVITLGGRRSCFGFGGLTEFVVDKRYSARLAPAPGACP